MTKHKGADIDPKPAIAADNDQSSTASSLKGLPMLIRSLLFVLFAMPSVAAIASESDKQSAVADLDMDGQSDVVQLRVKSETALLSIKMNSR